MELLGTKVPGKLLNISFEGYKTPVNDGYICRDELLIHRTGAYSIGINALLEKKVLRFLSSEKVDREQSSCC